MYEHNEIRDGFAIELSFEDEHISPCDVYGEDHEEIDSIIEGINSGEFVWVTAIVKAKKAGISLCEAYLGAVHYKYDELNQFVTDGYYEDMVLEAIEGAKNRIKELMAA